VEGRKGRRGKGEEGGMGQGMREGERKLYQGESASCMASEG